MSTTNPYAQWNAAINNPPTITPHTTETTNTPTYAEQATNAGEKYNVNRKVGGRGKTRRHKKLNAKTRRTKKTRARRNKK